MTSWSDLKKGLTIGVVAASAIGVFGAHATERPVARASDHVTQLMGAEKAAMSRAGASRIASLAQESQRPEPRQEKSGVTAIGRSAPEALDSRTISAGMLDTMPRPKGDAAHRCLSQAIYFESRGEPLSGQVAVAEVVLNRVDDRRYPSNVCGVTNQGAGSGRACQFSYACDGRSEVMNSSVARHRAETLAALMLEGAQRNITSGATHFHATYVRPGWARKFTKTTKIGAHIFYRSGTRLAQN